jgi:alkyldihydroxyacetonephosphate synthase
MTATRARSHWAWGYADKFPPADVRAAIGQQVAQLLSLPEAPTPREPTSLDAIDLPAPRLALDALDPAIAHFASTERLDRALHTYGRAWRDVFRGFHGDFRAAPDLVLHPRTEDEVALAMRACASAGVALVPFGGGTSVVGGVEGGAALTTSGRFAAVASLDLRALDRVLEIDPIARAARIQAGATGPGLEAQLAPHGLSLRHYPQSFEFSTLGGWIATRAGGHFATLYTHIDDLVESVRMLTLAEGNPVFETRRLPGSGAGPAPERLVIGSEGILGVITEAWVRLHPRPRFRSRASAFFGDFDAAVEATRAIAQAGLYPTNCRLLDAGEAALNFVADDGSHVLLLAFESADHDKRASMARAVAIAEAHGARVPKVSHHEGEAKADESASAAWRAAFLEAPYLQSTLVSLGIIADTFETACTWSAFPAMHRAIVEAATATMREVCGAGRIQCRFTHVYPDGPAPYYTFVAPGRAGEELAQWEAIKRAAADALAAHGGTITHHHAVGRMHRPWYERERPAGFGEVLRAVKRALDPRGILNPGVLIE